MATVKHEAKVTVLGDARSLKKAMGEAETSVKKATTGIDKSGSAMAAGMKMHLAVLGAAVVAGLGKFVASSVSAANDLNESINAVNVIFGESADTIHAWADDASASMGLSRRAVNESIIPIGAMLKNMGFATEDVAEKTQMLTQRAVDLGSQLNVTADVAMEKFRAGLAGESEPLKAFGVDVSVAALTTEALKLGLIESGEAMDRNVKAQAAMSIIMKETNDAAGDFANTLEFSLSNQVKLLKANTENMSARLGQKLLPATLEVTSALAEMTEEGGFLSDVLGGLADIMSHVAEVGASAISDFNAYWFWLKSLGEAGSETRKELKLLREEQGRGADQSRDNAGETDAFAESQKRLMESADELRETQEASGESEERRFQALRMEGIPTLEELTQATEDLEEAERDLDEARLATINTELKKIRADQDAAEALENLIDVQNDATSSAEDIRIAELELAAAIEIARIATEKQNAELDKMDGRRIDVSILYNWITKGANDIASVVTSRPQLRAKGGPVRKGDPYVVGEEGPEAFVPDQSGTIIPFRGNGGAALSNGGGLTVEFHGPVYGLADFEQTVVEILERARRRGA